MKEYSMRRQNFPQIPSSEITPKHVYLTRRDFIKAAGVIAGSVSLVACGADQGAGGGADATAVPSGDGMTDELGDPVNSFEDITHYNNYYEFTTDKEGVANLAADFKTSPWDVEVYGLVNNPKTYSVDDM